MKEAARQDTKKRNIWRWTLRVMVVGLVLAVLGGLCVLGINVWVKAAARPHILTPEQAVAKGGYDCILVLGAGVDAASGRPFGILSDRLGEGVALFDAGAAPRLLMTGDHGRAEYDEVNVMKAYAMERGVPGEAVFMDHAGFSTYESMYRARDVFSVKKVLIVTQEYHLYRAVYIARALGLEADGVASDPYAYAGQNTRNLREIAARVKDYVLCLVKPKPTYLGEVIPIWSSGSLTDD